MRKAVVEVFDDTLNSFFSATIEGILGPSVRSEFYSVLERNGIAGNEVSSRFDDVVRILGDAFGTVGWKIIVHKTAVNLHQEYSQRIDFSFNGTLRDKLFSLRQRVISNHIFPRHYSDADSFFDKESRTDEERSNDDSGTEGSWSGLYRYKKGVGSNSNPKW
jgi:hypothetical protein